jgi:hypothetical protein
MNHDPKGIMRLEISCYAIGKIFRIAESIAPWLRFYPLPCFSPCFWIGEVIHSNPSYFSQS